MYVLAHSGSGWVDGGWRTPGGGGQVAQVVVEAAQRGHRGAIVQLSLHACVRAQKDKGCSAVNAWKGAMLDGQALGGAEGEARREGVTHLQGTHSLPADQLRLLRCGACGGGSGGSVQAGRLQGR